MITKSKMGWMIFLYYLDVFVRLSATCSGVYYGMQAFFSWFARLQGYAITCLAQNEFLASRYSFVPSGSPAGTPAQVSTLTCRVCGV